MQQRQCLYDIKSRLIKINRTFISYTRRYATFAQDNLKKSFCPTFIRLSAPSWRTDFIPKEGQKEEEKKKE